MRFGKGIEGVEEGMGSLEVFVDWELEVWKWDLGWGEGKGL